MEQTTVFSEKSIRTLENDPQYFGGYLNMARHNIFSINNHIAKLFGLTELNEDGEIPNSFLGNKDLKSVTISNRKRLLDWKHIFVKTVRFMPVIKMFNAEYYPKEFVAEPKGTWIKEMNENLKVLFSELQEFRNDYTHYWSTEKGATRKTHVSSQLAQFLSESFQLAIAYTQERMKDTFSETDYSLAKKMKMTEPDNRITTEGLVFLTSMFLTREQAFLFIGKVKGLKGTQNSIFCATREVLMGFCIKLPHKKLQSEDSRQSLMMDILNNLNRCPKPLYNVITQEAKQQFQPTLAPESERHLLENSSNQPIEEPDYNDYIESLTKRIRHSNRFPYFALRFIDEKELFGHWRFQIDLGKIELANYTKNFDGNGEERRVIENAKSFGRLGDLLDEKTMLDKINANVDCFEQFAPHYNMDNNKIGLCRRTCHAVFSDNPNKDGKVKRNLRQPLPDAFLSIHELSKIVLLEYLEPGASEQLIDDFVKLSRTSLLTEKFIEEIKQKLPDWTSIQRYSQPAKKSQKPLTRKVKEAKERDREELLNRREALNNVLKEHKLNYKQIPTRILDYWLNISDVKENVAFSDRIKLMKLDCKNRLKTLAKHSLDPNAKMPKIGEMATFLAKDIVDMLIDENVKKQFTSFYYDKMQQCIALFADLDKKKEFLAIVHELKLNEMNVHPFLGELNFQEIHKTSQFYKTYLEEKGKKEIITESFSRRVNKTIQKKKDVSWIERTFYKQEWNDDAKRNMTVVKMPDDTIPIPYTIRKWAKKYSHIPDWRDWLRHITQGKTSNDKIKPIDLPTDLFDDKLMELLIEQCEKKAVPFNPDNNLNQWMKLWWQAVRKDETQDFYQSEREYIIYEQTVKFSPNQSDKFAEYYSKAFNAAKKELTAKREEENRELKKLKERVLPQVDEKQIERIFKRSIAGTEKAIRILQEEDRIALLMVEQLIEKHDEQIKLSKIESLLNETVQGRLTISNNLSFDEQGREIPRKSQRSKIKKTITFEGKRKNQSLLRKYNFDRRLPELFEYFSEQEIPLQKLQDELKAYEEARQEVFDSVFMLEEQIMRSVENRTEVEELFVDHNGNKKSGNIQHNPYLQYLLQKGQITDIEEQFLRMVRNGFSHNQFPQKRSMELIIPRWEIDKAIAIQIAEQYNKIIEEIIKKMTQLESNF